MRKGTSKTLAGRLIGIFLLVALIPIAIVGFLSFTSAKSALKSSELDKLYSERQLRKSRIIDYLRNVQDSLTYLARVPSVLEAFDSLRRYELRFRRKNRGAGVDVTSPDYGRLAGEASPSFSGFLDLHKDKDAVHDVLLIDGRTGYIIYSEKKGRELGLSVEDDALKNTNLAALWRRIMETEMSATVDFAQYEPAGTAAAFMGSPIFGLSGQTAGVIVLRLGPERLTAIMKADRTADKTGTAYLVGRDKRVRADSRDADGSAVLQRTIDNAAVTDALSGREDTVIMEDSSGSSFLASYAPISFTDYVSLGADFTWALVTETDAGVVFRPVSTLGRRIVTISFLIGLLVAGVAFLSSRAIARPVVVLARRVGDVSQGNLTVDVPESKTDDEIGSLVNAFGNMVTGLRSQVTEIRQAADVVASSAQEITTTVSQLSVSARKSSEAVSESATTADEVRQSAGSSGERAREVAEIAQKAVDTSGQGLKSTELTVEKMSVIQNQMSSVQERVSKLSEHSQAIDRIISVVQDLADQSNLLAVNASIEAARAGEHGRGFAVVANEIKSHTDQSKQATQQIRKILEDTRARITEAVEAVELSSKAVTAGVEQAELAGESIRSLSEGVEQSAQAAALVQASSRQQAVGAEQVADAMTTIQQITQQNMDAVSQLESAAHNLSDLAGKVQSLLSAYRV